MTMNYSQLQNYLYDLLQTDSSDANFATILPAIIQDAEGRIYRELDFLHTRTENATTSFTANNRNLTIPATILIVQNASVVTPAATTPTNGTRNTLEPASLDFINFTWPQQLVGQTVPQYFAMLDDATMIVAPTPDAAYVCEIDGIFKPAAISSTNTSTYLGDKYPDLFLAACMVFASGYQRDFGAMVDDPKLAITWEGHYQTLKGSSLEETQRQKSSSTGWTPYSPTMANPQRS